MASEEWLRSLGFSPEEIRRSYRQIQVSQSHLEQDSAAQILAIQGLADEVKRLNEKFEWMRELLQRFLLGSKPDEMQEEVGTVQEPTPSTTGGPSMSWVFNMFNKVLQKLDAVQASFADVETKLDTVISQQEADAVSIALILKYLTPPPPVALQITFTGGSVQMAKPKSGKLKFNILDNGHATATLTAVDAVGIATTLPAGSSVPSWSSSDAGVVLTPAADGMSCDCAPASPPVLVTGAVITASCTLPDGTSITGNNSADPLNVVAGPAGSFVIAVA